MKQKPTFKQNLKSLIAIHTLRQDTLFILRILNFQQSKLLRNQIIKRFAFIEDQRKLFEQKILEYYSNYNIDHSLKASLFFFNGKIVKTIKLYHSKLYSFSPKIAEMTDISTFLADLRQFSIECFSQIKNIKLLLKSFVQKLRIRYHKQFQKICCQNYKQQFIKNRKYLDILKQGFIENSVRYLQKSLNNLQKGKDSCFLDCIDNDSCQQFYPSRFQSIYNRTGQNFDIYQDNFKGKIVQGIERIRQQGFCDYSIARMFKLLKELKSKNNYNERAIQKHRNEIKNKVASSKFFAQVYKIQIRKQKEKIESLSKPRNLMFRITPSNKNTIRNSSNLMRPSTQSINSCQNRAISSVRQTLMEINIDQKMFSTKINRTRKRIPLIAIKSNASKFIVSDIL